MSGFDPDNFPDYGDAEPVCARCFCDEDIADFIEAYDGPVGCTFCGENDAPTAPLDEVAEHMRECLQRFYSFAADNLPYESKEGGYQAAHWDTFDLLFDENEIDLPRDGNDRLRSTLPDRISQDVWCDFDWLSLDYDRMLDYSWHSFCETIQHKRRFFFTKVDDQSELEEDRDRLHPLRFLCEIANIAEREGLVRSLLAGAEIYRCRPCDSDSQYSTARELGPPPKDKAVQANRMNPPGIPMMYGAETKEVAVLETRSCCVTVGQFRINREIHILDLAELPNIPGIFSGSERRRRLGLIFIHAFAREITKPVDRTDRIHIDYIPSQVVTEFFRDTKFNGVSIDGIRYPSALDADGRNLVLFATRDDLLEPDGTPVSELEYPPPKPWIRLVKAELQCPA